MKVRLEKSTQEAGRSGSSPGALYYKPSGKFHPTALLFLPLAGLPAALLAGIIYGYATYWNPFIYLGFLLALGAGFLIAFALNLGVLAGRVRSPLLVFLFAVLMALCAEYVQWSFFLYAGGKLAALPANPAEVLKGIQAIAGEGLWTIRQYKPTGALLYTVWGLEALLLLVSPLIFSRKTGRQPFCENCRRWVDELEILAPFQKIPIDKKLVRELERGNFSALRRLSPSHQERESLGGFPALDQSHEVNETYDVYMELDMIRCSGCDRTHLLTLRRVAPTRDKKNRERFNEQEIVKHLLVPRNSYNLLLADLSAKLLGPAFPISGLRSGKSADNGADRDLIGRPDP